MRKPIKRREAPLLTPLIADIMTANLSTTHQVTNNLIDRLTTQLADRDAELAAIRGTVLALITGSYMPTPAAIEQALYPPSELVATYRSQTED